jgi:hypothetical protein
LSPKYIRNTGKRWSDKDIKRLEKLAVEDTPTPVIGLKLGRTVAAVYSMASQQGISLMPPNPHHKKR